MMLSKVRTFLDKTTLKYFLIMLQSAEEKSGGKAKVKSLSRV